MKTKKHKKTDNKPPQQKINKIVKKMDKKVKTKKLKMKQFKFSSKIKLQEKETGNFDTNDTSHKRFTKSAAHNSNYTKLAYISTEGDLYITEERLGYRLYNINDVSQLEVGGDIFLEHFKKFDDLDDKIL